MNQALFQKIDAIYRPSILNVDVVQPKRLVVLLSGPSSSGKTTLAKQLEKHFQAIRLENDAVRRIVKNLYPEKSTGQISALIHEYMRRLRSELVDRTENGLWIIDASVDREYEMYADFALIFGFTTFLIAMVIPEDIHLDWVTNKGAYPWVTLEKAKQLMTSYRAQQDVFLATHDPDLVLCPGYDINTVYEHLERMH